MLLDNYKHVYKKKPILNYKLLHIFRFVNMFFQVPIQKHKFMFTDNCTITGIYLRSYIKSVIPLYDCVLSNLSLISLFAFSKSRIPEPISVGITVI